MNDFNRQDLTVDNLASSANQLVSHAEQLMRETAGFSQEGVAALRHKLSRSLADVRGRIDEAQSYALKRGREAASETNAYVHEKPWQVIAGAAVVGAVLALLLTPSRR